MRTLRFQSVRRVAIGVSCLAACSVNAQSPGRADVVLLHGHVITVDSTDRIAQAIAIAGQKIIAVGTDAHNHFAGGGGDRLFVVDVGYPAAKSVADMVAAVGTQAQKVAAGTWVEGRGWDEGKLAERRLPTAKDLDAVSSQNPVWLEQTTGHYGVANSVALAKAGITKDTRDPPNGTIDRFPDGTPTGVLKEAAQGLVRRLIPARSAADVEAGIRDLAQAFVAEGMTGLKAPGINAATWEAYKRVEADGKLPVRRIRLVAWRQHHDVGPHTDC